VNGRVVLLGGLSSETQSNEVLIFNHDTGWHRTYFQLNNGRYGHVSFPVIGDNVRSTAVNVTKYDGESSPCNCFELTLKPMSQLRSNVVDHFSLFSKFLQTNLILWSQTGWEILVQK
jgi:hypothetical protein